MLYADKTRYIYDLISGGGKYFFLSRPRRFGKSLLLSTIEAFYQGHRNLFKGLEIDRLTDNWTPLPVLHLDLNSGEYGKEDSLEIMLEYQLDKWEQEYNVPASKSLPPSLRFSDVISHIAQSTGKKVVILVDEYDKPLLNAINDEALADKYRSLLKAFYSNLKSMDRYIEFAMLTGVARFSKVSVFSDLNNLRDISFENNYSAICGITYSELTDIFHDGINNLANEYGLSTDDTLLRLKEMYDGYHFSVKSEDVYNPFSLVNVFASNSFDNYWFDSGTPSHLASLLTRSHLEIKTLSGYRIRRSTLRSAGIMTQEPVPALYQAGYLTISNYIETFDQCVLDFPNREVRESFLSYLVPYYTNINKTETDFVISRFAEEVRTGAPEDFMKRLSSLVASIPYGGKGVAPEDHFQNAVYLVFTLVGYYSRVEQRISSGRIDLSVETPEYLYIFEFKVNKSAAETISQIDAKGYIHPFESSGKKIFLISANFNPETRNIDDYIIQEPQV